MIDLDKVVSNLINLSERKNALADEVYLLTNRQTLAIEKEDIAELNLLIDKKQREIDSIKQLDIDFETIVSDLKTVYGINSLDELQINSPAVFKLKEEVANVISKIKKISELERENKEKLMSLRDQLESKMNHASQGKNAIKQYGNVAGYSDAYFIDKKIK